MFDVAAPLMNALNTSASALSGAASVTAISQTPYGDSRTGAAMAGAAEKAIFTEALLNAVHARLAEIKTACR